MPVCESESLSAVINVTSGIIIPSLLICRMIMVLHLILLEHIFDGLNTVFTYVYFSKKLKT